MDESRIAAIEAHLAVQQLAVRYAIAIDSRDLDLMVEQWVPNVWMGKAHGEGRDAVRSFFEPVLEQFYRSIHMIVGHRIDLVDSDNATGEVYCRAEHESGDEWVVQAIVYADTYRRVDERWGFVKRKHQHWYSTPVDRAPRPPSYEDWPSLGGPLPDLPHAWPTWEHFWEGVAPDTVADRTRHPGPAR